MDKAVVEKPAPEPTKPAPKHEAPVSARPSKLKTAFLYVLIAGLAAAALISVAALLIGQFNSAITKSLLTIFVLFTHSLLILAILWADRHNQVGKLLLPTAIVLLVFANMITTNLGTWEIIAAETAWRALGLYFLAIGAVFIIIGLLRLRIAHQATQIALFTSIGFITATVIALIPWTLDVFGGLDPLYFRIIAALSILATTAFLIGLIIRGIALAQNESLKLTQPQSQPTSGGLLAIYITVGVITAMVWSSGFTSFLVSGVQASMPGEPHRGTYNDRSRYY
jgi:hypothetical protein